MAFTRRLAINNNNAPNRAKHAASIVIRNEIISIGENSGKTHPLQKRFSKNGEAIFKHAEVDCIINALRHVEPEDLEKATLYVYRVKKLTKDHKYWSDGLSEPCPGWPAPGRWRGWRRTLRAQALGSLKRVGARSGQPPSAGRHDDLHGDVTPRRGVGCHQHRPRGA